MAQEDNMRTVFNLTRFEMQYPEFVKSIAPKIADEEILKPVHSRMKDFGYSQKIIDSTRIENLQISNLGELEFDVVSDYKSELGFDVAKAREKGTIRHFIKPVNAKALSFIAGRPRHRLRTLSTVVICHPRLWRGSTTRMLC